MTATIGLTGGAGTTASININGSPVAHLDTTGIISGLPFGNIIINPGFTINQRGYVSNAVLAAGSYGHDRWKAGASGGDYTFTQLNSNTTITIKTGKSLIQVVEDKNVQATRYVLSWEGTAQARYGVNSATPSGSYAASPIVITGQTAGTTMSVEFNGGTLGKVQLKADSVGSVATPFETRSVGQELALCQRYYEKSYPIVTAPGTSAAAGSEVVRQVTASEGMTPFNIKFRVNKRSAPSTVTWYNPNASNDSGKIYDITAAAARTVTGTYTNQPISEISPGAPTHAGAGSAGNLIWAHWTAEAEL